MPCWSRPAARCASRTAARFATDRATSASPAFIATGELSGAARLRTRVALHVRPVPLGGFDGAFGIAGKVRLRLGAVEQIKPLLRDQPERRMSRRRRAARHRRSDRARRSAAHKRREPPRRPRGCLRSEPPGGAGGAQFQSGAACFRRAIDEIGDRVEAIDREAGVAVDHHPFGGGGADRDPAKPVDSANKRPRKARKRRDFRSCRAAVIFPACGALIRVPCRGTLRQRHEQRVKRGRRPTLDGAPDARQKPERNDPLPPPQPWFSG